MEKKKTFVLSVLLAAAWIISDLIVLVLVGFVQWGFLNSRGFLPDFVWLIGASFFGALLVSGILGTILHLLDSLRWLRQLGEESGVAQPKNF